MVFFVCEGCNETLKKNQVDKHAQRCRSCHSVTCVDCQVTFPGDEYVQHVTCISEAEKYEKSLFKGKKLKMNPQEQWLAIVEQATRQSSSAPASIRSHLVRLGELGNVPRNKTKFGNFIKNSLRLHSQPQIDEIWSFLEKLKNEFAASNEDANLAANLVTEQESQLTSTRSAMETAAIEDVAIIENGSDDKKKKKKKRKHTDDSEAANVDSKVEASEDIVEVEVGVETQSTEEVVPNKDKKNKKNKKEGADDIIACEVTSVTNNNSNTKPLVDETSVKTKKKKKDRKD